MLEIFPIKKERVLEKVRELIFERTGMHLEILRTENGKPYVCAPLHFSIADSKDKAYVALSDKPVGIDFEYADRKISQSLISRLCDKERAEVKNDALAFLVGWTVKEAFIKLNGYTLATHYKRLAYYSGNLYSDGIKQNVKITTTISDNEIVTVVSHD